MRDTKRARMKWTKIKILRKKPKSNKQKKNIYKIYMTNEERRMIFNGDLMSGDRVDQALEQTAVV